MRTGSKYIKTYYKNDTCYILFFLYPRFFPNASGVSYLCIFPIHFSYFQIFNTCLHRVLRYLLRHPIFLWPTQIYCLTVRASPAVEADQYARIHAPARL